MSLQISEKVAIRLWSALWLLCASGGSIAALVTGNYPNNPTAKLIGTIFAVLGLVGATAQAQSKPLVKQIPPDGAGQVETKGAGDVRPR